MILKHLCQGPLGSLAVNARWRPWTVWPESADLNPQNTIGTSENDQEKRETHWQAKFKRCTRIEDTLKSRDICIFTLVVVFRRLWYFETLGRQHPNSPIAKGFQFIFYAKLYIFSSFKWTRNLHGLQPLNPECTSFSPDRLNTEPQPPLKMFRCDDETFRLTLDHIKDIPNHRDKWRTP